MSDCVGGDYVIVKNWKKWRNWWGDFQKGDETWHFLKALKWISRVSSVPIFKIMALRTAYKNLEGFKVAKRQKIIFFRNVFYRYFFLSTHIIKNSRIGTLGSQTILLKPLVVFQKSSLFWKSPHQFHNLSKKIHKSYVGHFSSDSYQNWNKIKREHTQLSHWHMINFRFQLPTGNDRLK